jgi:hypothetical protein
VKTANMQIAICHRTGRVRPAVWCLDVGLAVLRTAFPQQPMNHVAPRSLVEEVLAALSRHVRLPSQDHLPTGAT